MDVEPCRDSIDSSLVLREPMQVVSRTLQRSETVQACMNVLSIKKEQWTNVQRCVACSKKIHIARGTH